MSDTIYTVHDSGGGMMKIIDGMSGLQVGVLSLRGKLSSPPIVNGNIVSFIVELPGGEKLGTTHKLPSGSLVNQFRA